LDYIKSRYRATIVFIPFGYDGNPTDLIMSRSVAAQMKTQQKIYFIKERYHPQEIMAIVGRMDFLLE